MMGGGGKGQSPPCQPPGGAAPVKAYMERLFERESFKASLTTLEYEMRETEY